MPDQLFARYQREPDQAKRMEYLKKSAQMGYTPAQAELGDCYAQGRGVEKDYVKASEWYRRPQSSPLSSRKRPSRRKPLSSCLSCINRSPTRPSGWIT